MNEPVYKLYDKTATQLQVINVLRRLPQSYRETLIKYLSFFEDEGDPRLLQVLDYLRKSGQTRIYKTKVEPTPDWEQVKVHLHRSYMEGSDESERRKFAISRFRAYHAKYKLSGQYGCMAETKQQDMYTVYTFKIVKKKEAKKPAVAKKRTADDVIKDAEALLKSGELNLDDIRKMLNL